MDADPSREDGLYGIAACTFPVARCRNPSCGEFIRDQRQRASVGSDPGRRREQGRKANKDSKSDTQSHGLVRVMSTIKMKRACSMPKCESTCECGFDFMKARLNDARTRRRKRHLESYAVILDDDYEKVMKLDCAAAAAGHSQRALALTFAAADWVGSLTRCPRCGTWQFSKPLKRRGRSATLHLKAE